MRIRETPRPRFAVLLAGAILLAACGELASGNIVSDDRSVPPFTGLSVSSGINVELIVDESMTPSVVVRYDDNLIDNVVTEVTGQTLTVRFDGSVTSIGGGDRSVRIVTGSIDRIAVSGGAELTATGNVSSYELDVSGGAGVDARMLIASDVEVEASGGADAAVFASASIAGSASGGAGVSVHGNPPQVDVETSGGADLRTVDD